MNHSTQPYNAFLEASDEPKGGGMFLEDPQRVDNIVCQTTGRALNEFESRLADALMAIFAEEVTDLTAIVGRLNAAGHSDSTSSPWSADSLQAQLAQSASRLFGSREARS